MTSLVEMISRIGLGLVSIVVGLAIIGAAYWLFEAIVYLCFIIAGAIRDWLGWKL